MNYQYYTMNKRLFPALRQLLCNSFLFLFSLMPIYSKSQSISAQVMASTGGYGTNATGSLSFTIGETNTQTLSSATHMLTQGFQQPFELNILNVKAFLQGYYVGSGQMQDVLFNQGEYVNPSLIADSITVELRNPISPYALAFQTKSTMKQDGNLNIKGLGVMGQSYYIVLRHRNSIETWSANPILLSNNTNYDFSLSASQAYGSNQVQVGSGFWAIYSGDINQDGVVDGLDYNDWENDNNNFAGGYFSTDLNGDGIVDGLDFILWETNSNEFVGAVIP